jgi:hypothetical protein
MYVSDGGGYKSICGRSPRAQAAVLAKPHLLTAKARSIREALPTLVQLLGAEEALAALQRDENLLRARRKTLIEAYDALEEVRVTSQPDVFLPRGSGWRLPHCVRSVARGRCNRLHRSAERPSRRLRPHSLKQMDAVRCAGGVGAGCRQSTVFEGRVGRSNHASMRASTHAARRNVFRGADEVCSGRLQWVQLHRDV